MVKVGRLGVTLKEKLECRDHSFNFLLRELMILPVNLPSLWPDPDDLGGQARPKANSRGELSVYYYADSSRSSTTINDDGESISSVAKWFYWILALSLC